MSLLKMLEKIENTLAHIKFALVVILIFVVTLIVGTVVESLNGTEYANRLIYKSLPFMLLQLLMFLSIFLATLRRLPFKKRLTGFYILHLGLLLLFGGAFITYYSGIDGQLILPPNSPGRTITLGEDLLVVKDHQSQKDYTLELPFTAFPKNMNLELLDTFAFKEYLPFSENKLEWIPFENKKNQDMHSGHYLLKNDRFAEKLTLSIHPESSDFPSTQSLGPLNVHYLPSKIADCFKRIPSQRKNWYDTILLWDNINQKCTLAKEEDARFEATKSGKNFMVISRPDGFYTFFPELSPWPLNMDLQWMENSPVKALSLSLFESSPTLFLLGESAAFFEDGQWKIESFANKKIELPWMGFEIQLLKHSNDHRPQWMPYYTRPRQEQGQVVSGNQKAINLKVKDQDYWVRSDHPLTVMVGPNKYTLEIRSREKILPIEFNLERFKMNTNPGTNDPASYESFVTVFSPEGYEDHHIYMNNPLKKDGLTYYQASYFQANGGYGSVLSVNLDPGRPIKYLGSLLLVFGAFFHFFLNRVKVRDNKMNQNYQTKRPIEKSTSFGTEQLET